MRLLLALATVLAALPAGAAPIAEIVRDGDVILQPSRSGQAAALRAATGSRYTHVGLVFVRDEGPAVLEAVQPVKWTPLDAWVARGVDGHVVVMRLRDGALDEARAASLRETAEAYLGRPYDLRFEWSDDRIYCSELVFKAYESALGIEIGALQPLGDMNLDAPEVVALVAARTGGEVDRAQPIVTPASQLADDDLVIVFSTDPEHPAAR